MLNRGVGLVLLGLMLTSCVVEMGDEEAVGTADDAVFGAPTVVALGPIPPYKPAPTEPVEIERGRFDPKRDVLPRWEIHWIPEGGQDARILAIPRDGRGKPLVLWYGWYRKYGDLYFRTILHTGYLSLLDLEVIGHELVAAPLTLPPHGWPSDAVDPFVAGPIDVAGKLGPQREEGEGSGGVCIDPSTCGGDDDHTHTGGPPPRPGGGGHGGQGGAPGGQGGAPPSGGGYGGVPHDDPRETPRRLNGAITSFLSPDTLRSFFGSALACQKACAAPPTLAWGRR